MYGPMDDAVTLHSCQVNPFGYEVVSTFETEPAAADAEICAEFIRMPCCKNHTWYCIVTTPTVVPCPSEDTVLSRGFV